MPTLPSTVAVILNLYDGTGSPITAGSAVFTPTNAVSSTDGLEEFTPQPVTVQLNSGSFPVSQSLLPTDMPGSPSWAWQLAFTGPNLPSFTFKVPAGPVSFTGATGTPGVITWTATAALTTLPPGTGVKLTGGSLPAGVTAGTTYYIVSPSGQTLSLAATAGGSAIAFTGSGSGSLTVASYYVAGLTPVGSSTTFATIASRAYVDSAIATLTASTMPALGRVVLSASGALTADAINSVDATSAARTMTLPAPVAGQLLTVEKSDAVLANPVTITGSIRGSSGSLNLRLPDESVTFYAYGTSPTWYVLGDHKTLSSLDGRYLSKAVTGTVFVSPYGLGGGAALLNAGADYGPDTPGTVTSGVNEAVAYAVSQALATGAAAPDVVLLPGKFSFTGFSNTAIRACVAIDSGSSASAGPPVSVTIRGHGNPMNTSEGTGFGNAITRGATVIDASTVDVLAQGSVPTSYKQGRVFGVVPRLASPPAFGSPCQINAVDLKIENLAIIVPVYNAAGTGSPSYSLGGTPSALFHSGDSQNTNTTHWEFMNGVDAFCASSFEIDSVNVSSALAVYNPNGNVYAGGGGVMSYGSACGVVFPHESNQANLRYSRLSMYDLHTAVMSSTHVSGDQIYAQACQHVIYDRSSGYGSRLGRVNAQTMNEFIRHLIMPQLTSSLSGAFFDPVGDLYAPVSLTFPAASSPSSLIIEQAAIEASMNKFLNDDPSNPLTVVANVCYTGSIPDTAWAGGANLAITFVDGPANAQKVITGTTAGTATVMGSAPNPWAKQVIVVLAGYENTTATAQVHTFRLPFNNAPAILKDDSGGATVSTTTLTLPASMSTTKTGYIILEGY